MSKTESIRAAMTVGQHYSSHDLADMTGFPVRHIAALLKYDIKKGIVDVSPDRPKMYRMKPINEQIREQIRRKIPSAISLLKMHGYTVISPKT